MALIGRSSRFLSKNIMRALCASVRHYDPETGGEEIKSATVTLINKEDDDHLYVEAYSQLGFRLSNGFRIVGPCVLFPRSVLHWAISGADYINEESLSLFPLLEPKLDLLIIGIGNYNTKYDKNIIKYLRSHRINVEILPTDQACATFNFLNSERRIVAAGLVPPSFVQLERDEDLLVRSQMEANKDLFTADYQDPYLDKPGEFAPLLDNLREKVYPKWGVGKGEKSNAENRDEKETQEKQSELTEGKKGR